MKHDLDRLMAERNLDALVVEGPDGLGSANPQFNYFVKGQHLVGTVIKKRGEPAMLIHSPWEAQQAAVTGLSLVPSNRWNIRVILDRAASRAEAYAELRRQMLTDLGIQGRVGVYGTIQAGAALSLYALLAEKMPTLSFVGEYDNDIISAARLTKDADEVAMMRDAGRKTCAVVQAVVDFIGGQRADGDYLADANGNRVTIGDVHAVIRRELAANGLEAPEGFIFSQGHDAGLPHAHGNPDEPLQQGKAIVFDIYPRDTATGYYHDMTRTFAIGHAPADLQAVYNDVLGAFNYVIDSLGVGVSTKAYQDAVCDIFAEQGHPTIKQTYPIEEGYIHSLGHGIGLEVHEDFGFPALIDRGEVMTPGAVFTIEPGLYYPAREIGVRIEDTVYCTPEGTFESLTPFPTNLVISLAS